MAVLSRSALHCCRSAILYQVHWCPSDSSCAACRGYRSGFVSCCSDQGALQKQAHLQQQLEAKRQQLQQQRQQTLTDGGSDCQGAVEEQWRQLLNNTEAALDDLVKEMQSFQKVYQQVTWLRLQLAVILCLTHGFSSH